MEYETCFNITNKLRVFVRNFQLETYIVIKSNGAIVVLDIDKWLEFKKNFFNIDKEFFKRFHHQFSLTDETGFNITNKLRVYVRESQLETYVVIESNGATAVLDLDKWFEFKKDFFNIDQEFFKRFHYQYSLTDEHEYVGKVEEINSYEKK